MPKRRLKMRKIKEVLRLKFDANLNNRQIAAILKLSASTVYKHVKAAERCKLDWPLDDTLDDLALEKLLYNDSPAVSKKASGSFDVTSIHIELKKKGVTLQLLWEEYRLIIGENGYSYSQFCKHYRDWKKTLKRSMRQVHEAGDKVFIDYVGPKVDIYDNDSNQMRQANIFVACMGASNFTFAEATWTQSLSDFIASHIRMFNYFGGVPSLLVPDNLKSAVSKACKYDPVLNETYADLAEHYHTAIMPTRPRAPKDKSKVEASVLLVERWILAKLRHHQFFSLKQLNDAIETLLKQLNEKPFKKLPGCRLSHFEEIDKPALKSLPQDEYQYAEFKDIMVNHDYHIEIDSFYYSVPCQLAQKRVRIRSTQNIVEIYYRGKRVASHKKGYKKGGHTTVEDHMPKSHRVHAAWSSGPMLVWAKEIGPFCTKIVEDFLHTCKHKEQARRWCYGLRKLCRHYGTARVEAGCTRAYANGCVSFSSIKSILNNGLDRIPLNTKEDEKEESNKEHHNVRGSTYYTQ